MNAKTARLLRRYAYAVKLEAKGFYRLWRSMSSRERGRARRKYVRALSTRDFTRAPEPTR